MKFKCQPWYISSTALPDVAVTAFLVIVTCDRLTVVISTSHMWNLLRTEDVHLHTPALQIGTHFLLTLETIVFLFHLLSATSKPFSSLSTRLAHAARLVFLNKTCYINSLLLLLLLLLITLCIIFAVSVWRSIGTFARALDCTSTVRQPSLHMSAAAASRDITLVIIGTLFCHFDSLIALFFCTHCLFIGVWRN